MRGYFLAALCLLLAGCIGTLSTQGQSFNPNKVHLVDEFDGSYLFRGNEPLVGDGKDRQFAYAELTSEVNQILKQRGHKPLEADKFEIIDISLLNRSSDDYDLKIEKAFFEENPDKGKFIHWPLLMVDELIPAKQSSREKIVRMLPDKTFLRVLEKGTMSFLIHQNRKTYQHVLKLKQLLEDYGNRSDGKLTIFYVHCNAGCDRTGEFIAAYRMTNNKLLCSEATNKNTAECGRPQNYYSVNGTYWYCEYLKSWNSNYRCDCPETL